MRLYVEVARRTYARASTYRSATIAGLFTNTVFGFLLAYVLLGVYAQRPEVGGFDTTDTLTFIFVSQGLLTPLGLFATTEIADRITTGDVVVDLQRPYDHQGWWAAVMYGQAGFYVDLPWHPAVPGGRHRVRPAAPVDREPGRVPRRPSSSPSGSRSGGGTCSR